MWRSTKTQTKKKPAKVPASPQQALLRRQIAVGVMLVLLIGGLLWLINYLTSLPSQQIQAVDVMGGVTIPHSQVRGIVNDELQGSYLRLIPKRFWLLYPKASIVDQIVGVDRIKNAHVELGEDNSIVVAFEEHLPHGLWCAEVTAQSCLFIDSAGFAFAHAPALSGGAMVRFVTDLAPELEGAYATREYLVETTDFSERLERELGLFVTHVVKAGDFDTEYYVAGGGRIKVSQSVSAEESFANLQTVLAAEEFAHIEPGSFNYIDLRFGDKVFVNEVTEEVATTTASST